MTVQKSRAAHHSGLGGPGTDTPAQPNRISWPDGPLSEDDYMSERAAYSRVYWSIVDDPKFISIYDDDHHLAAWLRLLLIADQAHPASAHLPANVRRQSVTALTSCGLIDLAGQRYRVHGLDAERERRRLAATNRPVPTRDPSGTRPVPERDPSGIQTPGLSRAEGSQDKTSQAEPGGADPLDTYWTLSGSFPSGNAKRWLEELGNEFGPEATSNALASEWSHGSRNDFLKRAQNHLRAAADKAAKAVEAKADEREQARRAALNITPEQAEAQAEEARRLMSEWTAAMPPVSGPFQPIGSK